MGRRPVIAGRDAKPVMAYATPGTTLSDLLTVLVGIGSEVRWADGPLAMAIRDGRHFALRNAHLINPRLAAELDLLARVVTKIEIRRVYG